MGRGMPNPDYDPNVYNREAEAYQRMLINRFGQRFNQAYALPMTAAARLWEAANSNLTYGGTYPETLKSAPYRPSPAAPAPATAYTTGRPAGVGYATSPTYTSPGQVYSQGAEPSKPPPPPAGKGNYYKVGQIVDGYRWTGKAWVWGNETPSTKAQMVSPTAPGAALASEKYAARNKAYGYVPPTEKVGGLELLGAIERFLYDEASMDDIVKINTAINSDPDLRETFNLLKQVDTYGVGEGGMKMMLEKIGSGKEVNPEKQLNRYGQPMHTRMAPVTLGGTRTGGGGRNKGGVKSFSSY